MAARERLLSTDVRGWADAWTAIAAIDTAPRLKDIRVPTLCLVGELDKSTPPPVVQKIADAIPGARFVVMPGGPHMLFIEQPEETARVAERVADGGRDIDHDWQAILVVPDGVHHLLAVSDAPSSPAPRIGGAHRTAETLSGDHHPDIQPVGEGPALRRTGPPCLLRQLPMSFQCLSKSLLNLICLHFRFILEFRDFLTKFINEFDILTDMSIKVEGISRNFGLDLLGTITVFQGIMRFIIVY